MLQWMGGSRRKVATSRKSTQKRQKQYFEQRKRQQQQTAGQESYSENTGTCSPNQQNNRSLDILSLLNLSEIGQQCNPSCPRARGNSEGDFLTLNFESESRPTTTRMETIEVYPAAPKELKDRRPSSSYEEKKVWPRKISFDSSSSQAKALNENTMKVDDMKIPTDHSLSVLDLLGDDGQDYTSDGSLMHESHVAFSVEGLGNVKSETPVHSPRQRGRTFNYGCAPPVRPTKRVPSSKNFDCWLDDLEPEVDFATSACDTGLLDLMYDVSDDFLGDANMPFHESSPELPLFPRSMIEPFSDSKQKLRYNRYSNYTRSHFDNEEILYNCEDEDEYRWKARHSLLDENFLDEECDLSWKNWSCDLDSTIAGNQNISNWEKPDFSFENIHMPIRRPSLHAVRRFSIPDLSDSYTPYQEQNRSENYCDFIAPEKAWCPTVEKTFNVRDVSNLPAWSSIMKDDARDTLSLLSEESCSSSAVWGEAKKSASHNPTSGQKLRARAHTGECISPVKKKSLKSNISSQPQEPGKIRDSPQKQDSMSGQGKSSWKSNSSTSTPAHYSTTDSQEMVVEEA